MMLFCKIVPGCCWNEFHSGYQSKNFHLPGKHHRCSFVLSIGENMKLRWIWIICILNVRHFIDRAIFKIPGSFCFSKNPTYWSFATPRIPTNIDFVRMVIARLSLTRPIFLRLLYVLTSVHRFNFSFFLAFLKALRFIFYTSCRKLFGFSRFLTIPILAKAIRYHFWKNYTALW